MFAAVHNLFGMAQKSDTISVIGPGTLPFAVKVDRMVHFQARPD
jgi:hypothetical protein